MLQLLQIFMCVGQVESGSTEKFGSSILELPRSEFNACYSILVYQITHLSKANAQTLCKLHNLTTVCQGVSYFV